MSIDSKLSVALDSELPMALTSVKSHTTSNVELSDDEEDEPDDEAISEIGGV
ncbi:hypothetical protein C0995_007433, partial [Termitomyces sp. Mi166